MLSDRQAPLGTLRRSGTVRGDVPFMHPYDVRASDLDRERVVEFLKAHYTDGRLQPDELAWRTDAAYRAVGLSELDRLTADLPALVAPRRRRHFPLVTAVVLFAALVALLVVVPPEAWLVAFAVAAAMGLVAFVFVAPIAVPLLLLALVVHVIVRAARPRPRRVGWR
jgi:hypothetical protein